MATTLMTASVREFPAYRMRYRRDIDELAICCTECKDAVDEFTAIAKGWRYHSDGTSLLPYCPECARPEWSREGLATTSAVVPAVSRQNNAGTPSRPSQMSRQCRMEDVP